MIYFILIAGGWILFSTGRAFALAWKSGKANQPPRHQVTKVRIRTPLFPVSHSALRTPRSAFQS